MDQITSMIDQLCYKGFNYRALNVKCEIPTNTTILYIGGAFQALEDLYRFKMHLTQKFNVLFLELPGFGKSDFLPEKYGFNFYSACIEHALQLCRNALIYSYGYSYGGVALFKAASELPGVFNGMIAAGACATLTSDMVASLENLISLTERDPNAFADAFKDTMCHPVKEELVRGKASQLMLWRVLRSKREQLPAFAANYRRLLREYEDIGAIEIPVLGVVGEYDNYVKPTLMYSIANYCPAFSLVTLPGCDHFFHLQATEADLTPVLQFVNSPSDIFETPIEANKALM